MSLKTQDALSNQVVKAASSDTPVDCETQINPGTVIAVFKDQPRSRDDEFLGLVSAFTALRHRDETFLKLLSSEPQQSVTTETSLEDVVGMQPAGFDYPVAVLSGKEFVGAVTRESLLATLLCFNQDIKERLCNERRSVRDEKHRREGLEKREQDLNRVFRRLVSLLAKPAGPDLFQRGLETLCVLLDATYGAITLKDDKGQLKEGIFAGVTPGDSKDLPTFLKQRAPLINRVLETESSLILTDIPDYLNSISFPLGHPIMHTFLGIPILGDEKCFGCVYFCGETDDQKFTEDDHLVAAAFSEALALVLSQAKDRAERKRLQQEREILWQLGQRLADADSIEKAAEVICRATDEYLNWQSCSVSIRRSGYSRFRQVLSQFKKDDGISVGNIMEYKLHDLPDHFRLMWGEAVLIESTTPETGPRLLAPVRIEADLLALVDMVLRPRTDLSEADRNFMQRLGDQLGPTLARCQAEEWNSAFLSLAFELSAAVSAEGAARIIAATADDLLGWDSCWFALQYPELGQGQEILHMDIINGQRQDVIGPYALLTPPGPIAQRTMREGPQLILRDLATPIAKGLDRFGDVTRPSLSLMFVPFRIGPTVVAVFSMQSYSINAYNQKDLNLLQTLANYCAGAIERIRLASGIPAPIDYPEPNQPLDPTS